MIEQVKKSVLSVIPVEDLVAGVVLTGGTSLLGGLADKFQRELGVGASLGIPSGVTGFTDIVKSPTCATAIGMLQYALRERRRIQAESGRGVSRICRKALDWLTGVF